MKKLAENLVNNYFKIYWNDLVICAWCGQNPFNNSNFIKDFQCRACGAKFEVRDNLFIWALSELYEQNFGTQLKRKIKYNQLLNVLSRVLNPISSPFLPFRYITNLRTREYYKRTIFDRQLADRWANHYLLGLNLPMNSAVLDHGCGKGRHVGLLTQLGFNVSAQDIESHSWWGNFSFCKFQSVPPSAPRLPWPDEYFDLVLDFGVLGLFPQDRLAELFKEVRRVLKPNGHWLILEANDKSYGRSSFQQPTLPLSTAQLISKEAGFIEVDFSYEGFYSPVFPQFFNFIRKVCGPWQMNLADFDSWLALQIPVEKRGLWLLRLRRD